MLDVGELCYYMYCCKFVEMVAWVSSGNIVTHSAAVFKEDLTKWNLGSWIRVSETPFLPNKFFPDQFKEKPFFTDKFPNDLLTPFFLWKSPLWNVFSSHIIVHFSIWLYFTTPTFPLRYPTTPQPKIRGSLLPSPRIDAFEWSYEKEVFMHTRICKTRCQKDLSYLAISGL